MSEKETKKQEQYTHLYKMESYGPLDSPKNHKDQPTLYLWKGQHLSTDTECWTNRIFVCGGGGRNDIQFSDNSFQRWTIKILSSFRWKIEFLNSIERWKWNLTWSKEKLATDITQCINIWGFCILILINNNVSFGVTFNILQRKYLTGTSTSIWVKEH